MLQIAAVAAAFLFLSHVLCACWRGCKRSHKGSGGVTSLALTVATMVAVVAAVPVMVTAWPGGLDEQQLHDAETDEAGAAAVETVSANDNQAALTNNRRQQRTARRASHRHWTAELASRLKTDHPARAGPPGHAQALQNYSRNARPLGPAPYGAAAPALDFCSPKLAWCGIAELLSLMSLRAPHC